MYVFVYENMLQHIRLLLCVSCKQKYLKKSRRRSKKSLWLVHITNASTWEWLVMHFVEEINDWTSMNEFKPCTLLSFNRDRTAEMMMMLLVKMKCNLHLSVLILYFKWIFLYITHTYTYYYSYDMPERNSRIIWIFCIWNRQVFLLLFFFFLLECLC